MKSDSLFISSIPFPGVAVCNINRIKKSALIKLAHRMKGNANMSFAETYSILKNLYKIHDLDAIPINERALLSFILRENGLSNSLSKIMKELSHSCDDMLKTCKLGSFLTPCKNLFKQAILPVSRSCCISKNSIITGDTNDLPIWTQVSNGVSFGVFLNLDLETNEYLPQSATLSYGAEIMIFDPRSHPYSLTFGVSSMFASYKEVTFISVDPSVDNNTYAHEGDDHSVCKRSYPSVKHSNRTFHYSFSECQFRCMMSKMLEACQCILYKHSFEEKHEECPVRGIQCINDYLREATMKDYGVAEHDEHVILNECKCPPACESILYKSTTSTLIRDHSTNPTNETHVFIFFERSFVNLYEREPIYTAMELLGEYKIQDSRFHSHTVLKYSTILSYTRVR
ncbi:uncharacterized protein LOC120351642 [Nilaparvata lugens]|uniref:uncharacterized protein LOC120351642 n=1 Tax=Nilaparvata lugens TaxID=108931 RepID=UPI00193D4DE4|nr:uncharacterized protein LOC120351642 [Nilaparvata lugens]